MKKTLVYILVLLSLIALILRFGYQPALDFLGYKARAGIKISSIPEGAIVFINGEEVGRTPYENENMAVDQYQLKLMKDEINWQGGIKLNQGTLSVVNRELAASIASSSGEILTLSPGKGVMISSTPEGAEVETQGKILGKTPLQVGSLEPGEYTFLISRDNYLKRSIRASLPAGMLLRLDTDLAISEVNLSSVTTPSVSSTPKVVVKQTPTGFLRVREKPSTSGKELGRVKPDEQLILLEELGSWYRVRMDNNVEGYVSASYVRKQ